MRTLPIEGQRALWRASAFKGISLDGVIPKEVAEVLRARVRPGLRDFYIADRGRYQVNESLEEPEIAAVLAEMASSIVETDVKPTRLRWQRFVHGDYAMQKDDTAVWAGRSEVFELVLDLSQATSREAQVVFTNGKSSFLVPQESLLAGLVDRRGGVVRYDRYLTCRIGAAEVFRLSLSLAISNR